MVLCPEGYEKYITDKQVVWNLNEIKDLKKFYIKKKKFHIMNSGEEEISIVSFFKVPWTIINPIYNYIYYGSYIESSYLGTDYTKADVKCINYIGNIKPRENKIDLVVEWKYYDLSEYKKVLDEIKKKEGLNLIHNAPDKVIEREKEVRLFKEKLQKKK